MKTLVHKFVPHDHASARQNFHDNLPDAVYRSATMSLSKMIDANLAAVRQRNGETRRWVNFYLQIYRKDL